MLDVLLEAVMARRNEAQKLRREGRKELEPLRRQQLFAEAADELKKAITMLRRGLRAARGRQDGYTSEVCDLLKSLSQTYGSLGGTWRDARAFQQAIEQYDTGNKYEAERRRHCNANDTYNMLQRLVVRLLALPDRLRDREIIAELGDVHSEIEGQITLGRTDSWALADLALVQLLSGADPDTALADFEKRKAEFQKTMSDLEKRRAEIHLLRERLSSDSRSN